MDRILGIGSRIDHPEFGKGVVTNVTAKMYWVTFIDRGLETIDVADTFEVIEAAEDEVDTVSFYEVEKSSLFAHTEHFFILASHYIWGTPRRAVCRFR